MGSSDPNLDNQTIRLSHSFTSNSSENDAVTQGVCNGRNFSTKLGQFLRQTVDKISSFVKGIIESFSQIPTNLSEKWGQVKADTSSAFNKLTEKFCQIFPQSNRSTRQDDTNTNQNQTTDEVVSISHDDTNTNQNQTTAEVASIINKLITQPKKKVVYENGRFSLTDRNPGLSQRVGSGDKSKEAIKELLKFIRETPSEKKQNIDALFQSEWAKRVLVNNPDLAIEAYELKAQIDASTPEGAKAMLEELNGILPQLLVEKTKLRLKDGKLTTLDRQGTGQSGKSNNAKVAATIALIRLREGIKGGGVTVDSMGLLKNLKDSSWMQTVGKNFESCEPLMTKSETALTTQRQQQTDVLLKFVQNDGDLSKAFLDQGAGGSPESFKKIFEDNLLMPLDAFALGMNTAASKNEANLSLKTLLTSVKNALNNQGDTALNKQEKQLLVSMVREIDRQGLNAVKLNQDEYKELFKSITGQDPTKASAPKEPATKEQTDEFLAILANARSGNTTQNDVTNCRLNIQSASFDSLSNLNDLEDLSTKIEKSSQSSQLAQSFNAIANYVVDSILTSKTHDEALNMCRFFFNVIGECMENNDFNSAMAIFSALSQTSIHRLMTGENKELTEEFATLFKDRDILKGESNYKALRARYQELQKNGQSYIPFVGMINTDNLFYQDTTKGQAITSIFKVGEEIISGFLNAKKYVREQMNSPTGNMRSFFDKSPIADQIDDSSNIEIEATPQPVSKTSNNPVQNQGQLLSNKRYDLSLNLKPRGV
jgi:hypothetical protein